ncbi:hypothetical protein PAMP_017108 [Pampus punctatissimus]
MELSDYTYQSERRSRLVIGFLIFGVLCILQATLNISLHLAFYSKHDTDRFPFNSSIIEEVCQIDQSQQNSTQSCLCCNKLLRRLLRENQALKTERDHLQTMFIQRSRNKPKEDYEDGSGDLMTLDYREVEY